MLERRGEWFGDRFYRANSSKRKSRGVLATFRLIFIGAIMLVSFGFVKVDFLGNADQNNVWINMKYKAGISNDENMLVTKTDSQ